MNRSDYRDWKTLLAEAGNFWIGLTKAEVLLAQQSEADLLCLLRRKYGLSDSEALHQISEYISHALNPGTRH